MNQENLIEIVEKMAESLQIIGDHMKIIASLSDKAYEISQSKSDYYYNLYQEQLENEEDDESIDALSDIFLDADLYSYYVKLDLESIYDEIEETINDFKMLRETIQGLSEYS